MLPVIVFPDVVAWAIRYLQEALDARPEPYSAGVLVSKSVPNPRPAGPMVVVRRDGGPRLDAVRESARLGIRVFASTDADAEDLTALVRGLLGASPGVGPVRRYRETAGPSSLLESASSPEQRSMSVRYFTAELIIRGSQL